MNRRECAALLGGASIAWLCSAGPALAVPEGAASGTAEMVCELRALAAQHPDPKLRGGDHLAARLCTSSLLPRQYAEARLIIDAQPELLAAFFYVNARTYHIDARFAQAATQGSKQVVVLGAGFDTRAYRFHESYPKLRFFEVDLPATIDLKKRRVTGVLGRLPSYVRYVPIDFNSQSLGKVLRRAGYDPAKKTFFILEGVTMYVNEAGNRATLRFVRQHSPSGSMLVYDYVLRRVVDGDYAGLYAARSSAEGVARIGEPFVTGWTPQQAAAFAQEVGLTVLEDLGPEEQTRRYLTGSNGRPDGRTTDWQRIIDAKVP
jgi:methyltransferase (TIGR00027 family)